MPSSVLGKRKARTTTLAASPASDADQPAQDVQAIFQRYFEAQFKPLDAAAATTKQPSKAETVAEDMDTDSDDQEGDDDDDDRDSWSGVSEDGDAVDGDGMTPEIEVVSHIEPSSLLASSLNSLSAKRTRKALLSSKVPSATADDPENSTSQASSKRSKSTATEEDAPSLLKNDLELQRLLTESHLFNPSKVGTLSNTVTHHRSHDGSTEHAGRNRLLATDLRMAALGSKTSIYAQAKMPMSHRKGMNAAAASREGKRRREARENGIILERPSGNTDALKAYTRAAGVVKNKNSRTAQGHAEA
ncbi:hypothetical protein Micbo1qcDRAFT_45317 [Microdochium bolleyi]|uniref:Uncharacterized protein n=1 Tax=Microdochium bolleyi TaxID=196109 RepID=A0A136JBT9_9PEZI|nr:hypothetical protein Micbo1qcDRAFT_45317 [Microdochium bolleyi]